MSEVWGSEVEEPRGKPTEASGLLGMSQVSDQQHASLKLEEGTRTPILSVQKLVHDVHELKQKLSWKYTARYLDNNF